MDWRIRSYQRQAFSTPNTREAHHDHPLLGCSCHVYLCPARSAVSGPSMASATFPRTTTTTTHSFPSTLTYIVPFAPQIHIRQHDCMPPAFICHPKQTLCFCPRIIWHVDCSPLSHVPTAKLPSTHVLSVDPPRRDGRIHYRWFFGLWG